MRARGVLEAVADGVQGVEHMVGGERKRVQSVLLLLGGAAVGYFLGCGGGVCARSGKVLLALRQALASHQSRGGV